MNRWNVLNDWNDRLPMEVRGKSVRICICLRLLVNCCILSRELPLSPDLPGRIAATMVFLAAFVADR